MTSPRATALLSLATAACLGGCGSGPGSDAGETTSSGSTTSTSDATTATEPEPTSSSSASDESTTASGPACDSPVSGGYDPCFDAMGAADTTQCAAPPPGGGTSSLCVNAALVPGGTVCTLVGCTDACDCPPAPGTGTATPACISDFVVEGPACVLACLDGEICPDGMVCSYQACVWPPV